MLIKTEQCDQKSHRGAVQPKAKSTRSYPSSNLFIGNISEENFPPVLVVIHLMASQTTSVYNAASSGSSASHPYKHKLCTEAWRQLQLHFLRWTHLFLYVKWANMSHNCQLCWDQTTHHQPNWSKAQTKTRQHYSYFILFYFSEPVNIWPSSLEMIPN